MKSKLDELRFGIKYRKDIINSLALLMTLATEPDDKNRISMREYDVKLRTDFLCKFRITKLSLNPKIV